MSPERSVERAEMFRRKQLQDEQADKFARAIFAERYDVPYHPIPWVLNAARAVQRIIEADMTRERALEINDRLCTGYFHLNGLGDYALPDIRDVSLKDAIEATQIIHADPVVEVHEGRQTITATIAPNKVAFWYVRIIMRAEMEHMA